MPTQISDLSLRRENILGSPVITGVGLAVGVGQYIVRHGDNLPGDAWSWVSFILGAVVSVLAAFLGTKDQSIPTSSQQ